MRSIRNKSMYLKSLKKILPCKSVNTLKNDPLGTFNCWIFYISLFIVAASITSCTKDVPLKSQKQITSFVFLLTNNSLNVNVIADIDQTTKSISAIMPEGTNIKGLIPTIEVSDGASVSPLSAQNFNNPISYTVTAEDGSTAIYTARVTAEPSQRDVLQAILDANPNNTLPWDLGNTKDLNDLDGVTTNFKGEIISLYIDQANILVLPPEIGNLIQLDSLTLSLTNLTSLPPEIGSLTNLKKLNLFGNTLTSLPPEIGSLTKLESLFLYSNKLTSLPSEIGNLAKLKKLLLFGNILTSLPSEIGNLTKLVVLSLPFNNLTSLPPEIGNLTQLKKLYLESNKLVSIPLEIGFLTKLEELNLSINNLTSIPPEIGFLSNLSFLGVSQNNLTLIPMSICLSSTFNNFPISLDLGVPCMTNPDDNDALISIFSANPNNTLGWAVDHYPEVSFTEDGRPKTITANNKGLKRIPTNINFLSSLETLNMNGNSFGSIPSTIGDMINLSVLTLANTDINTVPATLGRLDKLALLSIINNPITSIPQSVCDLQKSKGGILTILTDFGEECN